MSSRSGLLLGLFGGLALVYGVARYCELTVIFAPETVLTVASGPIFVLSFLLLAADAFLPTPSSAVMVAGGYLFGPLGGTVLAITGLMTGNALGYLVAHRGQAWLERKFPREQRRDTEQFWQRWGALALVVSRPVPVLAESVLFLAATTQLGFWRVMFYCLLGTVPTALFYVGVGFWFT